MLPVVVVHGGAGQIPKERLEKSTSGVCSAARAGYAILRGGGSSMDAVVEAVSQLENNPSFNAGNYSQDDVTSRHVYLFNRLNYFQNKLLKLRHMTSPKML